MLVQRLPPWQIGYDQTPPESSAHFVHVVKKWMDRYPYPFPIIFGLDDPVVLSILQAVWIPHPVFVLLVFVSKYPETGLIPVRFDLYSLPYQ